MRSQIGPLLALPDDELLGAVGGEQRRLIERERTELDVRRLRDAATAHGVAMICRCEEGYPARLHHLDAPPAVLHVAGDAERFMTLAAGETVAVVGSRRASSYGLEMAHSLARDLAASGVLVVSGLARGIDTAAHQGALQAGRTMAILPGPAERPYPAGQRGLYRQVIGSGAAVSELPCGAGVRRWSFLARNRIIAALAGLTIVVEATERSGALPTAQTARELGRHIGAVPGRVTTPQAAGPNALLADGATLIRNAQDALDCLYGAGIRTACADRRTPLTGQQRRLLGALEGGHSTAGALHRAGIAASQGLAILSELEIGGWVRRGPGGAFTVIP